MKKLSLLLEKYHLQREEGYTLVEIIIAMQLAMLLISLVHVNYLFFFKYQKSMENRFHRDVLYYQEFQTLFKKLTESRHVLKAEAQTVSFLKSNNDTCTMVLKNQAGFDNGSPDLLTSEIQYGKFDYLVQKGVTSYWSDHPPGKELKYIRAIRISVKYTDSAANFNRQQIVRLIKRKSIIVF